MVVVASPEDTVGSSAGIRCYGVVSNDVTSCYTQFVFIGVYTVYIRQREKAQFLKEKCAPRPVPPILKYGQKTPFWEIQKTVNEKKKEKKSILPKPTM